MLVKQRLATEFETSKLSAQNSTVAPGAVRRRVCRREGPDEKGRATAKSKGRPMSSIELTIVVDDSDQAFDAISRKPGEFITRIRTVLSQRHSDVEDRLALEHDFGIRVLRTIT